MSVTSLTLSQENTKLGIDLLSVHNPLSFIVDAVWTGTAPVECKCNIYDNENALLGTFFCIPYKDVLNTRQFIFIADGIFKAYMDSFDDITSPEKVVHDIPQMTKFFKLVFETEGVQTETSFVGAHAVQQFGQTPQMENVYNNAPMRFIGCQDKPIYIYFYNTIDGAGVSVNDPFAEKFAADDDLRLFIDEDNTLFLIE
jgi:hypothetical protein